MNADRGRDESAMEGGREGTPRGARPAPFPAAFTATTRTRFWASCSVGTSLAAASALVLGAVAQPFAIGLSTAIVATTWTRWMIRPAPAASAPARAEWLSSIVAAAACANLAALFANGLGRGGDVPRLIAGVTVFGALVYLPAMLGALAIFGAPIERVRVAQTRGVDAEERAHASTSVLSCAVAACAWLLRDSFTATPWLRLPRSLHATLHPHAASPEVVGLFAGLGLFTSIVTMAIVASRVWDRVDFLRKLEGGPANGYRIDTKERGSVVVEAADEVRDYRADDERVVMELDEDGRFVRRL